MTGFVTQPARMSDRERQQMQRKHVFCVNGSATFLEFVRMLLEEESYNVTTTNFVPATFAQIVALAPDLIIIDLEVGLRAGFDLLDRLRSDAVTAQLPVIIVSTDQKLLDEARHHREDIPPTRFLAKPFNIEEMLDAVHVLIGAA
jgi:chemosensory pili system protein ChpA (sensor histidine kinase/response regulator)